MSVWEAAAPRNVANFSKSHIIVGKSCPVLAPYESFQSPLRSPDRASVSLLLPRSRGVGTGSSLAADGQRSEGRFARPCPRSRPPCSRRARVDAGAGPEGSARAGLGMRVRGRPSALTSRWRREAKDNKDGLPTGTITDGRPSLARSDVPPHRDISSARPEQPLSYAPPTNVLRYAAHSFNSSRLSF